MLRRAWQTRVYFSRMLHGRGVCRLAAPRHIAACITAAGDIISQLVMESRTQLDQRRLLVCTALGAALEGVALQHWYALLHVRVPGQGATVIARRLLLHHVCFAPALAIPAFIAGATALEFSSSGRNSLLSVRQAWGTAVSAHLMIVAPTQLANAWLLPRQYQVLCANSCAFIWALALSTITHSHFESSGVA